MEDEEDESLLDLVAHAKRWPAYVRMVSWEFKNETTKPKKQRRRKKSSEPSVDSETDRDEALPGANGKIAQLEDLSDDYEDLTLVSEDSDVESIYFSTEEVFDDQESNVPLEQRFSEIDVQQDLLIGNELDKQILNLNERHRAPSKKQKRKRRLFKMIYYDQLQTLPFMQQGLDIDEDINEVVSEVKEKQIQIRREVSSLSMMCMQVLRGVRHEELTPIPNLLKVQIYGINNTLKFKKFQLSWLQNLLASTDHREKLDRLFVYNKFTGSELGYVKMKLMPLLNIWNSDCYLKYDPNFRTQGYKKSKITACLMYTDGIQGKYEQHFLANYIISAQYLRIPHFFSVLATVMECMMPCTIPKNTRKHKLSSSELEHISKSTFVAIRHVKSILMKRFRNVIEDYFDVCLPYVLWSRGDIHLATDLFCQLSKQEKRSRFKALYLNEAARMHAQVAEFTNAAKFYRLAADAIFSKPKHQLHLAEVNGQMMMLLANLQDQGDMTDAKAKSSWSAWKTVFSSQSLDKTGAVRQAVESWLCHHSGSWKDENNSWLDESVTRLTPICEVNADFHYYLSMIHAMRGDSQNSLECYKSYRANMYSTNSLPGGNLCRRRNENPWQPLVETALPLGLMPCLQVIWRTQLKSLRVQSRTQMTREADLISHQLNLRMTADGYLTGDMQMLLPPIGGICLDPYTGSISFNNNRTEPWQALVNLSDPWRVILPTPLEVYHDDDGVKVHLLMSSENTLVDDDAYWYSVQSSGVPAFCNLIWIGSDGSKVKVNLLKKIKDLIFKREEQKILDSGEKTILKECLEELHWCYNKGYEMDGPLIIGVAKRKLLEKENQEKEARKSNKKVPKQRDRKIQRSKLMLTLESEPVMYGKCVFLTLKNNKSNCLVNFYVVANCSTAKTFLDLKFYDAIHGKTKSRLYDTAPVITHQQCTSYHGYRIPNADVLYYHFNFEEGVDNSRNLVNFRVFDQTGSVVDKFTVQGGELVQTTYDGYDFYPQIVQDQLIAVTWKKKLWCRTRGEEFFSQEVDNVKKICIFGEVIIAQLEDKVQFVSSQQLTKLKLTLTSSCKRSLCLSIEDDSIIGSFRTVKVLGTEILKIGNSQYYCTAAVFDTCIALLQVPKDISRCEEVTMTLTCKLAGYPTEVLLLNKSAGFLVSFTHHTTTSPHYSEHLLYYNYDGTLLGILPFLGPGPRSFCPVYLPGDGRNHESGLYLYMRDGHDGIIGIKL